MELKLEDIKLYLKSRQNFGDLVEILKLYRTDDIKRACQKVLKARKKEKSKLEKWLEEHHFVGDNSQYHWFQFLQPCFEVPS
jgi:predicted NAD/FAD-binding protein